MKISPPTDSFPYPTLPVDWSELIALHNEVVKADCSYKLAAKAAPSAKAGTFHKIDCSGYVRWLLLNAGVDQFPDGSFIQHDAVRKAGFKTSTIDALDLGDNAIRIVFLSPLDGGGIGHVALWHNGKSVESHGGVGPDRRATYQCPWLRVAHVYVLTAPG